MCVCVLLFFSVAQFISLVCLVHWCVLCVKIVQICCVLLEFQHHCEEDIAVYLYVFIKKNASGAQVPSHEGLYELDMLAIKIFKK